MSSSITNTRLFSQRELIIKGTHRGLWYQDGVLTQVLGAGRYVLPRRFGFGRRA